MARSGSARTSGIVASDRPKRDSESELRAAPLAVSRHGVALRQFIRRQNITVLAILDDGSNTPNEPPAFS